MKTMESDLLAQLETKGVVEWEFANSAGLSVLRPHDAYTARCLVTATGVLLIELRNTADGHKAEASQLLTGKEMREIPETFNARDVELPIHILREMA